MTKPAEYWTLFSYGASIQICSKHKTAKAANKEAGACEKRSGLKHRIVKVTNVKRRATTSGEKE